MTKKKSIAAISMVRNDTFFADKWIAYYGTQFGLKNLYLFVDGMDQKLPKLADKINCYQVPHVDYKRAKGDRKRSHRISKFAQDLFENYEAVLAMDIDEFLVVDPIQNKTLIEYLSQDFNGSSLSALGLDVGQHPSIESPIELNKPYLSQRAFAQVSDRYTKPIIAIKPLQWGSGFHRVKGKNFNIDPNLFLFHFGLVDYNYATKNTQNQHLISSGWKGHFDRRFKLYEILKTQIPQEGDLVIKKAQLHFAKYRKWYAWNKPAPMKGNALIRIPARFETLL